VPLPLLLSVGLFESDKVVASQDHGACDHDHGHCVHEEGHEHGHSHDHKHEHKHEQAHEHSHDAHPDHAAIEGFTSLSFRSEEPLSLRRFQNFLDNQLPEGVFRAKGILWFQESERRHIFHLAGKRFSIDDSDWPGQRSNQMVLIGRDLNHEQLRQQLQACVARSGGQGFG
jgi:G3E family GTPase